MRAQVAAERLAGALPPASPPPPASPAMAASTAAWESSLSESMVLGALDLLNGPVPSAHSPPPPLLPSADPTFPVHTVAASAGPLVVPVVEAAPSGPAASVGWWSDQKGEHPVPPSLQHLDPVTVDPLFLSTR